METVSAKDLKEKLKKERTVKVEDLPFRIRKVPLLLLAEESDDLWELARQGREGLAERIKGLVASPSLARMRRILLAGVVQPKVSMLEDEDAVCVDQLLSDFQLSAGIFVEIITFSLEL